MCNMRTILLSRSLLPVSLNKQFCSTLLYKDIKDPHKIRITFNSYFTEIGPTLGLASKINISRVSFRDFITPSHTKFKLIPSTVDKVSKHVVNLSTSKADGLDRIPARLLKASCPFTAASLANVLQG